MTDLVACLGSGKGTWNYINDLIASENWDKIYLVTNTFGKENFKPGKEAEFIVIDENIPLIDLVEDIRKKLDRKLGIEVALNLISGSGKEHMALLAALLRLGVAVRIIALTPDGVKEL